MTSSGWVAAETVIVSILLSAAVLAAALAHLRRRRPGLAVGRPLAAAFGLRLIAIAGVASTGLQSSLRGGDETTFLTYARLLAGSPLGQGFFPDGPEYPLHTVVFALQMKLGGFTEAAMRVTQVGIALLGILLILAAVHDLAGPRAARIAGWVLALEPASIFFNSALHKEPLMVLAGGLMVYGGTKLWQRLDYRGILLMAIGGFIAVETRPYAGWFLVSAGVLVILHGSLRRLDRPLRAMPLVYAVVIAGFVAAPAIVQATSSKNLATLQQSQDANTNPDDRGGGGPNGNNLALERVNYSTRGAILQNLPKRMLDVVVRPYPWQVANASQQLGAVGSLFALAGLALLLQAAWRRRGSVLGDAAPILYPMLFLLMAYSLSAGNAGTGFRYRTHLVTLGFAMLLVLRERHRQAAVSSEQIPAVERLEPASTGVSAGWPNPAAGGV
jgi:hypothetical protein